MTKNFELRHKPELKIRLNESNIEIIDISNSSNCGFYAFQDITEVKLIEDQTDWFVTIFSWVFDLFSGGLGGNYKNKAHLKLKYKNKSLKIWLVDANFKEAERITNIINKKITK